MSTQIIILLFFLLDLPILQVPGYVNTGETEDKPQSKIWEYDKRYFAALPFKENIFYSIKIFEIKETGWLEILSMETVNNRNPTDLDCKPQNDVCHIVSNYRDEIQIHTISYNHQSKTYAAWPERPEAVVISDNISSVETVTAEIDSTERMWILYNGADNILVRHSEPPYTSWSNEIELVSGLHGDDLGTIIKLPTGQIAAMWSNQNNKVFGFRVHDDMQDPSVWSEDERPGQDAPTTGAGVADDHINTCVSQDGTMYAAIKTSYDLPGYTQIGLFKRDITGTWTGPVEVDTSGTRPISILDDQIGRIYVIYTLPDAVVMRAADVNTLTFNNRSTIFNESLNNASSSKDNLSNYPIIASNASQTKAVILNTSQTIKTEITPKSQALGLHLPTFAYEVICSIGEPSTSWAVEPPTATTISENTISLVSTPTATTALSATTTDTTIRSHTDLVYLLVAINPVFRDFNGDGQNSTLDLQLFLPYWQNIYLNDPNGDNFINILDLLYIPTTSQTSQAKIPGNLSP